MSSGYRLIFIGFILILLDFRINTFDLLPDFIGYIFVINGLNGLSVKGSAFEKAKPLAILLLFLSLPSLFGFWENSLDTKSLAIFPVVYEFVLGLSHLIMMYLIFAGTWEMATKYEDEEWGQHLKSRWNLYAIVNLLFLCMYALSYNFPTIKPLIIVLIIVVLIVEIVAIVLIKKSELRSERWRVIKE